jgi:hypothetical protein
MSVPTSCRIPIEGPPMSSHARAIPIKSEQERDLPAVTPPQPTYAG